MSAGSAAWRLLGAEAWRLLDSGRLRNAARLSAALSAVGGSMPALLLSCRPPDRAAPTPLSIARGALPPAETSLRHFNQGCSVWGLGFRVQGSHSIYYFFLIAMVDAGSCAQKS